MKFKTELEKQLYYQSQIDYSYWRLKAIYSETGKPQAPLEAMIDKATGFNTVKLKQSIKEIKMLINTIIKCKKELGFDTENDTKSLTELKSI
jgi:hypothetical protein